VFSQLLNALARAILVFTIVVFPALAAPSGPAPDAYAVLLLATVAAVFVLLEYSGPAASFLEFRHAPPFNRLRFGAAALVTVAASLLLAPPASAPPLASQYLYPLAQASAALFDWPYAPPRLFLNWLSASGLGAVTDQHFWAVSLAYALALATAALFFVLVRLFGWPARLGAFNLWLNLPTFDPTTGEDVVQRLQSTARLNLILGISLPFLMPMAAQMLAGLVLPSGTWGPQSLIWGITFWSIMPLCLLMRAIALGRVAQMIQTKRARHHAGAGVLQAT
jgi:hypothetical protein